MDTSVLGAFSFYRYHSLCFTSSKYTIGTPWHRIRNNLSWRRILGQAYALALMHDNIRQCVDENGG